MTRRLDNFFSNPRVRFEIYILLLPFTGMKPRLFNVFTHLHAEERECLAEAAKLDCTYISVRVWRDQQYTHYIFLLKAASPPS